MRNRSAGFRYADVGHELEQQCGLVLPFGQDAEEKYEFARIRRLRDDPLAFVLRIGRRSGAQDVPVQRAERGYTGVQPGVIRPQRGEFGNECRRTFGHVPMLTESMLPERKAKPSTIAATRSPLRCNAMAYSNGR